MVLLALVGLATAGCRTVEYNQRLDGQPADPDQYELSDVRCFRDTDRLRVTGTVTNTGDRRRLFDAGIRVRTLDGDWVEEQDLLDWVDPGGTTAVDWWFGQPERFAESPECEVTVLDSPEEVLVEGS